MEWRNFLLACFACASSNESQIIADFFLRCCSVGFFSSRRIWVMREKRVRKLKAKMFFPRHRRRSAFKENFHTLSILRWLQCAFLFRIAWLARSVPNEITSGAEWIINQTLHYSKKGKYLNDGEFHESKSKQRSLCKEIQAIKLRGSFSNSLTSFRNDIQEWITNQVEKEVKLIKFKSLTLNFNFNVLLPGRNLILSVSSSRLNKLSLFIKISEIFFTLYSTSFCGCS